MAGHRQKREGPVLTGRHPVGHRLDPPAKRKAPCGVGCSWARRGGGGMTRPLPRTSV
jgi:hypothetical protein